LFDLILEDNLIVDDLRTEMGLFISSFIMETLLINVHDELGTFGVIKVALLRISLACIRLFFAASASTS
jgi:DNA replication protein DnaD